MTFLHGGLAGLLCGWRIVCGLSSCWVWESECRPVL